jgi:outer membrane protein
MRVGSIKVMAAAMAASVFPAAALGETLEDALSLAYGANPTIRAERARLDAVRESKAQAWAGALPQITASGGYSRIENTQTAAPGLLSPSATMAASNLDALTAGVSAEQPVFTGFRNFHAIKQAEARIRAGGAQLASVEQQVMRDVADAYFDVRFNMAIFELNRRNADVLLRQKEAAAARFRVGEITRTDVAQTDARLAAARADLADARGELAIARANYARLVGRPPGDLEPAARLPELPDNLESAQSIARQFAPDLIAAREQGEVSRRQVKAARGALLPSVSLAAGYRYAGEPSAFIENDEQFAYGARVSIPLFQGGLNYSRVREAKALHARDRSLLVETERAAVQDVAAAWERLLAARASTESTTAAVAANEIALEGVRREALLGARTTLDALDAEQELLNAQISLAAAERNAQSASFALLAAIGLLTPEAVGVKTLSDAAASGESPLDSLR